jgi:hypothetical protein
VDVKSSDVIHMAYMLQESMNSAVERCRGGVCWCLEVQVSRAQAIVIGRVWAIPVRRLRVMSLGVGSILRLSS